MREIVKEFFIRLKATQSPSPPLVIRLGHCPHLHLSDTPSGSRNIPEAFTFSFVNQT